MGDLLTMTYLRVRELAESRGMTITDLHMKTGISYSTVHALWHNKVAGYQRATLEKLAIILGVRVGDLFGGDPEWPPQEKTASRRRKSA